MRNGLKYNLTVKFPNIGFYYTTTNSDIGRKQFGKASNKRRYKVLSV